MRKIHFISGLMLTIFIGLHLFNHFMSVFGADKHIETMNLLRKVYRNLLVESILMIAVVAQIISGIRLFKQVRKQAHSFFEKIHIWLGIYLAFFLIIHLSAVLGGRLYLQLDTNFYFGVAGLNSFPFSLFFIPYYALAIISFFGHLASIHSKKMKRTIFGLNPTRQSYAILFIGVITTISIFYGLTNHFKGVIIPEEYNIMIGK